MNTRDFTSTLEFLFEPSTGLTSLIDSLDLTTCPSIPSAISTIRSTLTSSRSEAISIINAHPRLGPQSQTRISASSQAEQASLGDDDDRLADLQDQYERQAGFRYVVFVNSRSRMEVTADLESRLHRLADGRQSIEAEMACAIDAVCDIALDRLGKMAG